MPKEATGGTTQITVRLNNDWLPRLDVAAARLSRPGLELTRADLIRIAVGRGLEQIERDLSEQEPTVEVTNQFKKLGRDEIEVLRAVQASPPPHSTYAVGFKLGANGRIQGLQLERALQLLWSAGYVTKLGSLWKLTAAGQAAIAKP